MEHIDAGDDVDVAVGAELDKYRRMQAFTYDGLAAAAPTLARASIVRYLKGQRSIPMGALAELCGVFQVDPAVVIADALRGPDPSRPAMVKRPASRGVARPGRGRGTADRATR